MPYQVDFMFTRFYLKGNMMNSNNCLKIGILGGTFDPVHIGHIIVAEEARVQFGLDKILLIPSGTPPHKDITKVTKSLHRLNMLKEAVKGNVNFEVSMLEIERAGYTYTVDTLIQLKSKYDINTEFYFIIGADVIFDILTWRNVTKVFTLCQFIACLRPEFNEKEFDKQVNFLKLTYGAIIHKLKIPPIDISSTNIRKRLLESKSIEGMVNDKVEEYIYMNKLYKNND